MLANNLNDETDKKIRNKFVLICENLGIDETDSSSAWENYFRLRNDHTFEVSEVNFIRYFAVYV